MDSKKILTFVIDAGATMLKNGAETSRVEDTMLRLMSKYPSDSNEVFATPTGVFCSIVDCDGNILTSVRRINQRTINLEKITLINSLSRNLISDCIDLDKAIEELKIIDCKPSYKNIYKYLASGLSSACFAFIFGGTFIDSLNAFIAGFFLYIVILFLNEHKVSDPITNILSGAFVSIFVIIISYLGLGDSIDKSIIGSIMPLVPGVGFTNAVRDIIAGEYLSGTSRMVDAVLVAVCVATGVGVGLGIGFFMIGDFILWF